MKDKVRDELLALEVGRTPGDLIAIDRLLEEQCQYPHCDKPGETHRQNTSYVDDLSNWCCYCPEHRKENDEHWRGMWTDYYDSVSP